MKKILGRLFKWKAKSERPAAGPSVAAHEIALKHAAVRQRTQSAEDAAKKIDAPALDGAVAPGKGRANKKNRRTKRVGSLADDLLREGRKTINRDAEEPGKSAARSGALDMEVGKTGKTRRRKGSSCL